jgi:hypothetical protein
MSILISLSAVAAAYLAILSIRWLVIRSRARAAVAQLHEQARMAEQCRGDVFGVQYANPGLMFQVLEEVQQLHLALEGSLVIMSLVPLGRRLLWKYGAGYLDVTKRAELGIKALNDAAFFSQFPAGVYAFRDVLVNGIPLRER